MDSYTYNSYARYYDKAFPSDFQKRCNESAALREDYKKDFEWRFPNAKPETKPLPVVPFPVVPFPVVPFPSIDPELDMDTILCPNIN